VKCPQAVRKTAHKLSRCSWTAQTLCQRYKNNCCCGIWCVFHFCIHTCLL